MNRKDRRHSGRVKDVIYDEENSYLASEHYDDWTNYRDGLRNPRDRTLIKNPRINFSENYEVERFNKKNIKHEKIRKLRKQSPRNY